MTVQGINSAAVRAALKNASAGCYACHGRMHHGHQRGQL